MVDRPETILKGKDVKYRYAAMYEVEVSQNDTVTLDEFDSSVVLDQAWMAKKSDGTSMTCTKALNVVTVSGAGTNIDCILFAVGVKA